MHGYNFERFANASELQNTIQYVVKQGDSIYNLAKMYDTTVEELMNINKLSSTMIYPNQILFIPKKDLNMGYNQPLFSEYVTKKGDTIGDIIKQNSLELSDFEKYNNILNLELAPNQILEIDKTNSRKMHEVKVGDSYNSILNRYNITPMMLLEYNKENWLKPGSKIIIG